MNTKKANKTEWMMASNGCLVIDGAATKLLKVIRKNPDAIKTARDECLDVTLTLKESGVVTSPKAIKPGEVAQFGDSFIANLEGVEGIPCISVYRRAPFDSVRRAKYVNGKRAEKTGFVCGPRISKEAKPNRFVFRVDVPLTSVLENPPKYFVDGILVIENDGSEEGKEFKAVGFSSSGFSGVPVQEDLSHFPEVEISPEFNPENITDKIFDASGRLIAFYYNRYYVDSTNIDQVRSSLEAANTSKSISQVGGAEKKALTALGMAVLATKEDFVKGTIHVVRLDSTYRTMKGGEMKEFQSLMDLVPYLSENKVITTSQMLSALNALDEGE